MFHLTVAAGIGSNAIDEDDFEKIEEMNQNNEDMEDEYGNDDLLKQYNDEMQTNDVHINDALFAPRIVRRLFRRRRRRKRYGDQQQTSKTSDLERNEKEDYELVSKNDEESDPISPIIPLIPTILRVGRKVLRRGSNSHRRRSRRIRRIFGDQVQKSKRLDVKS